MKKKKLPKYQYAGQDTIPYERLNNGYPIAPQQLSGGPLDIQSSWMKPKYQNTYGIGNPSAMFQDASLLAQLTNIGANEINTNRNARNDRARYVKELQPKYQDNYNSDGLNNIPLYAKNGGGLDSKKAFQILHDGTSNGKKLTDKQKKFFAAVAFHQVTFGKKKKAAYGLDETKGLGGTSNATVEAEGGEVYQQPNGHIVKISDNAPSHEDGGVPINNVQRVLEDTSTTRKDVNSKSLVITKDTFKKLFGIDSKRDLSHSEALEKVDENSTKESKKVESALKNSMKYLNVNSNDIYSKNSLDLNSEKLNDIPTRGEAFDTLFQHQELVKNMLNITNDPNAKYGKYIPKAEIGIDDVILKGADKTGGRTPTGRNNNDYNFTQDELNRYGKKMGFRVDTNKNFQTDLYNYMTQTRPDIVDQMWTGWGNTNQGARINQARNVNAFADGDPKARTMFLLGEALKTHQPEQTIDTPRNIPGYGQPPISLSDEPLDLSLRQPNTSTITRNSYQKRDFNQPLEWYDLAGPLMGLTSAEGTPTNFNPADISKIRLKRQNPLPTLQSGQRDFNAALSTLQSNGSGQANATNIFASKYALDNQVLGQYENINNNIDNQEIIYNANASDRQSLSNQQSREVFEQKQLGTQEAVRQQKLRSFDDIFTRVAENAKLNREGNLLMKLFPNFNQTGEYNGTAYNPRSPIGMGAAGANAGIKYITDPNNGSRYRVMYDASGKPISSSKVLTDNKAVGAKGK